MEHSKSHCEHDFTPQVAQSAQACANMQTRSLTTVKAQRGYMWLKSSRDKAFEAHASRHHTLAYIRFETSKHAPC
eukprot:3544166-Pleurochrysis_carterae.AAC.1